MNKETGMALGEIRRPRHRFAILHLLLPLLALTFGIAITAYLLNTSPKAMPAKRQPAAIVVEVKELTPGLQRTTVTAMGEIFAAQEIEVKPRISGEVIEINKEFIPGGHFVTGAKLLTIDPTDYELIVHQIESDVAKAESDLSLEMGNQRIAESEYKLLGESVTDQEKELILRLPHLQKLQATLAYARSRLAQARLDLARTHIQAPFDGVIAARMVDVGAKVTESTVLAKFIGIDAFWLRLTLPIEQLQWLKIPNNSDEQGSAVHIFPQGNTSPASARKGQVIRLYAALEEQGRMAQVLVKIDDPLCLKAENRDKPKLLLGSYVHAEIEGITIDSGFSIDRAHIHNGDTVWLMDDNGMLDIRPVDISFRGRENVIVQNGIKEGERLVVSSLSSPIAGTPLRLTDVTTDVTSAKPQPVNITESSKDGKRRGEGVR